MEPWAIEEVLLRPAATLLACAVVPLATPRLLGRILGGGSASRTAGWIVRPTEVALAALAGASALGPALIARPGGWMAGGFAALCASVAFASGWLARRRRRAANGPEGRGLGVAVGAVTASILVALTLAPRTVTAIPPRDAPNAGESAARWRLRVDPWDPVAMIAAGWAARRREAHPRAAAWAAEARAHGANEADVLELEAEIHAARGECAQAQARFDEALRVRAEAAFAAPLAAPLELGGYHLPPTLISECGR